MTLGAQSTASALAGRLQQGRPHSWLVAANKNPVSGNQFDISETFVAFDTVHFQEQSP